MSDLLLPLSCVLLLAFVIGMALSARATSVGREVARRDYPLATREGERRDTFTNEEIMLPGVDIRHSNARQQIAEARRAQLTGDTRRINRWIGDPVEDRIEVVQGEVVDEPQLPRGGSSRRQLPSNRPLLPKGRR